MTYILSEQLDDDAIDHWKNWRLYQEYLQQHRSLLPKRMHSIATSSWWYRNEIPEAPHDAILMRFELLRKYTTRGSREQLVIGLESGFGGQIVLTYTGVIEYLFKKSGHEEAWGDHLSWRYDEFSSTGRVGEFLRTIDWACGDTWIIRARNLKHHYIPEKKKKQSSGV